MLLYVGGVIVGAGVNLYGSSVSGVLGVYLLMTVIPIMMIKLLMIMVIITLILN